MPILLTDGLILPLIKQGSMQLGDLVWYKEEEKDELFDLRGQFCVAACLLDRLASNGDNKDELKGKFT